MRIKACIFVVLALALFAAPISVQAQDDSAQNREYQVKAAFLYNFVKFVDWPKEKVADGNEPIIIGVIGKDPFGKAFDPIKKKQVKGKKVVIKRFQDLEESKQSDEQTALIRKCHLLFICSSEKKKLREIINLVKDDSVLTVGEVKGFLESGGIINFLMEDKKVCFEINNAAAKQTKLKIRSKLLRLAKRIIPEKPSEEAKN